MRTLLLLFLLFFAVSEAQADQIGHIDVQGTQRIERATVLSYLDVKPGMDLSKVKLNETLKTLFATGLFSDVTLRLEQQDGLHVLVVAIVENPVINRVSFEGNRKLKDDDLKDEIQLRPRSIFTKTRVQNDVVHLLEIYRRQGRFSTVIEPKIILLDQNRVNLVFEISEGPKTKIRRITFIGNKNFDDTQLREEIRTEETRWYRFLSSHDRYDQNQLVVDEELLRRFYLAEGYADFRVLSSSAELTADRKDFFLTFTLEEGGRYKFGDLKVITEFTDLDSEFLREYLTMKSGKWYNANKIDTSIDRLTEAVSNLQYAFVDVRFDLKRNRAEKTVDITFNIKQGPRVFVEQINITGNLRTTDKVIRREFLVMEGDPFNLARLRQSERKIRNLNFFDKVTIRTKRGSAEDLSRVEVEVEEKPTGELSLGAGFSTTDGVITDIKIRERNLLGKGKDLSLSTRIGSESQEYDISYTEPHFLDYALSAGVDLFHTTQDFQEESSFDQEKSGIGLRVGYEVLEKLYQRLFYRFEENTVENVSSNASAFIREQQGTEITSLIAQELVYDARNSRINPTKGYVASLYTQLAGFGGDVKYIRNVIRGAVYHQIVKGWVAALSAETGMIDGLNEKVAVNNRFFLGGTSFKGFKTAGIGPRDITGDSLGGNLYSKATLELEFPLGIPEDFGIKGHLFNETGTVKQIDGATSSVLQKKALRMSIGAGISWQSPVGPLRLDFAKVILKQSFDKTENLQFNFGARF